MNSLIPIIDLVIIGNNWVHYYGNNEFIITVIIGNNDVITDVIIGNNECNNG